MAGQAIQLERRRLNEEIEDAFIVAAKAASNVEMKLSMGKGNIVGDLQDFYGHFNYLVRLTGQLKEMETPKDDDPIKLLKDRTARWLHRKDIKSNEMESYAKIGLEIFDEYYKTLMHQGIIALPTRKG